MSKNAEQKHELPPNEPCSEEFMDAVCDGGGSISVDCDACGRTNFSTHYGDTGFFEEGELERLEANLKSDPDKYHGQDNTISYGHIAGRQLVWGCPCGWRKMRHYENFLRSDRETIIRFYKKWNEATQREAAKSYDLMKGLK